MADGQCVEIIDPVSKKMVWRCPPGVKRPGAKPLWPSKRPHRGTKAPKDPKPLTPVPPPTPTPTPKTFAEILKVFTSKKNAITADEFPEYGMLFLAGLDSALKELPFDENGNYGSFDVESRKIPGEVLKNSKAFAHNIRALAIAFYLAGGTEFNKSKPTTTIEENFKSAVRAWETSSIAKGGGLYTASQRTANYLNDAAELRRFVSALTKQKRAEIAALTSEETAKFVNKAKMSASNMSDAFWKYAASVGDSLKGYEGLSGFDGTPEDSVLGGLILLAVGLFVGSKIGEPCSTRRTQKRRTR